MTRIVCDGIVAH